MARTYLLRTIRKWAAELQEQESVEQNSQSTNSSTFTRREFIGGLGAASMYSLLPKWTQAATPPRIAIIGAGIAGLACALSLDDRRVRATVFEASSRVGGRMFSKTDHWDNGQISEWCGELIDSNHQTVRGLAKRFNLPLDDLLAAEPENSEELYFFNDFYTYSQAKADFKLIFNDLKSDLFAASYPTRYDSYTQAGFDLDNMSIYDWIESRIPGGHESKFGQLLDVAYTIEYGAESADQSALNLLYLLGYQPNSGNAFSMFGVSDERFHIRGGNQRLPEAIKNHLGSSWFQFGKQLAKISSSQDGSYRLRFKLVQGGGFVDETFDYIVLAIPFAVLRDIDYREAGFDLLKNTAIQELGLGRNGKLQLQFGRRLWNEQKIYNDPVSEVVANGATYSDTGYQCSWEVTRAQPGPGGILNFYSGGDTTEAMRCNVPFATESNSLAMQDAMGGLSQIEPVFPGAGAAWNGKLTQSLTHLSSFFKASYSYYRVGQYTAFGGYEGVTQGGVLFCGEHTSQDFQGFMEGGASEGVRAAKELLQSL
jgi:monoamine oxidase